ncbi:hypothetical protein AWH48_03525 [Domibacillus aminovorans]|uniref:Uncharacterized protein n=2 Tax=Bacillales TaxID=1385 RepID=A0A177KQW7_9BACI|nr:hypothetical protein AWH48_03525 [Domibacillus aminovorans]
MKWSCTDMTKELLYLVLQVLAKAALKAFKEIIRKHFLFVYQKLKIYNQFFPGVVRTKSKTVRVSVYGDLRCFYLFYKQT